MTALYAYICRISLRHIKCLLYGWVPSKLLIHTVYTYVNLYKNDYVSQLLDRKNDHFIARIRTFWTWIFIKNMIRFMYIQIKLVLPTFRIEKFLLRKLLNIWDWEQFLINLSEDFNEILVEKQLFKREVFYKYSQFR